MIYMIFINLYNKFMEKIVKNLVVIVNGNEKIQKKKRKWNTDRDKQRMFETAKGNS